MTEKRFTLVYEKGNWWAVRDGDITLWKEEVIGLLNELHEENQSLKERIAFLEEFITSGVEYTYSQNIYEENEQLKQQLNYIQNSISEQIKHQKTELGQKALKEIIEDYNEWLLGHKGSDFE